MKNKFLILIALIGVFSAISEASNQGHITTWGQWFTQAAWQNKYTWHPHGLWQWWPFIVFTDAFHFFKFLWVVCLSFTSIYSFRTPQFKKYRLIAFYLENYKWIEPIATFAIYSITFQITYWLI